MSSNPSTKPSPLLHLNRMATRGLVLTVLPALETLNSRTPSSDHSPQPACFSALKHETPADRSFFATLFLLALSALPAYCPTLCTPDPTCAVQSHPRPPCLLDFLLPPYKSLALCAPSLRLLCLRAWDDEHHWEKTNDWIYLCHDKHMLSDLPESLMLLGIVHMCFWLARSQTV